MKHLNQAVLLIGTLVSSSALLVACGGGGGGDSAASPSVPTVSPDTAGTVPDSATVSAQSYASYLESLPADNSAAPLSVTGTVAPVADDAEPLAL